MTRLRGALLLAIACLPLALACGNGGGGADAAAQQRTVRFWQFWDSELVSPLVAEFEAANPGVRVEMETLTWASGREKIAIAIASGTGPDLIELGSTWVPKFAAEGALQDLTERTADLRDGLVQWEPGMRDGRVFAIPWLVGTRVLFLNQTLLAAAGADTTPPATWTQLLEASRAAHHAERGVYGFGMNAGERGVPYKKFLPFVWSNGGDVFATDGGEGLTGRAFGEALDYYASLVPYSLVERQDQLDQTFLDGKLGFWISGGWLGKKLAERGVPFRWRVAPLPRPREGAPSVSFAGAEMLAVPSGAARAEEALALARFLVEGSRALVVAREVGSVLPAAAGIDSLAYFDEHPDQRIYLQVLRAAKAPPADPDWVEMQEFLNAALEDVLFGRASSAEALERAGRQIDEVLARR